MIQWWKRFRSLPVHFSACVHTSQGEKFLIIGLPRVHLLLLNGNRSQGYVWDSSNRRRYYRFHKVLMGAVTRDTFTVVNDPLIRLDKKLGPTGFSRQGFYSLSRRENKHPSNFERSVLGPPLAENRPTPALRICRWLPIFANWKKKENRFLGATKHLFFLACCQIFAFYHFKGFFPFLLRQQPLTEPKLVPAFLFFSAAKAPPLSPAVVVSPTACSSGLDLGSGYCAIFMVSFLERILCTTESISYFLQESASAFPTVYPFARFLCCPSCPFPATPWWTVSLFLPRTLLLGIQRHLESPRHEALPRVWRALTALLSWASPPARGVSGTVLGLVPGLCLLSSGRVWRKRLHRPARQSGHPLCCSFPIRVFVHSISCWLGNYPLHFAPVLCLVLYLRFICEKETAVQDPSKVLQLPFRRLYHKLANHLTLETLPPRCFLLILPLFLRKAPSFGKRTETPLFKYNLFFVRVGVQELAKVFVCRKDEVREMTSKWVLDLARFELRDYFSVQLDPFRIPTFDLHPSVNVLANVRCVVQNSTSRFWEHTILGKQNFLICANGRQALFGRASPKNLWWNRFGRWARPWALTVFPALEEPSSFSTSAMSAFATFRNNIAKRLLFWEQSLPVVFCSSVCFRFGAVC